MESTGDQHVFVFELTLNPQLTDLKTYFKDLDSFSHLLNTIKDGRFWLNFWGGTKVPTRGMAPAEVQVGKARFFDLKRENGGIVGGKFWDLKFFDGCNAFW